MRQGLLCIPEYHSDGTDGGTGAGFVFDKAGVAGTSFGAHGEGYVRFSYANSKENILRAIERIRAVL